MAAPGAAAGRGEAGCGEMGGVGETGDGASVGRAGWDGAAIADSGRGGDERIVGEGAACGLGAGASGVNAGEAAGVGAAAGAEGACSTRSISRSCSSESSMVVPQFQQSAMPSQVRTDIGARQSGQTHSTAPSATQNAGAAGWGLVERPAVAARGAGGGGAAPAEARESGGTGAFMAIREETTRTEIGPAIQRGIVEQITTIR